MISQFFILSERGDTLAYRDYRGDVVSITPEIFHRRLKMLRTNGTHPPPIFNVEGTQFVYIIQYGLYFVCTTIENVSPAFILEFLQKIASLCKDYCGVVHEEAVRYNFALIYELLDEVLDYGYPQSTSTDELKEFIFNEPHPLQRSSAAQKPLPTMNLFGAPSAPDKKVAASSAPMKSVMKEKNEVFIDVIERLTVVVSDNGQIIKYHLDGCIKVQSFLAGSPQIRIDLNENLRIRNWENNVVSRDMTSAIFDDVSLHECVNQDEFEKHRSLLFSPPAGGWVAFRYSIFNLSELPFQVNSFLEESGDDTLVLRLRVRCTVPSQHHAVAVAATVPLPKSTTNDPSLGNPAMEYKQKEKLLVWNIKRIHGGSEQSCNIKINVPTITRKCKQEFGPVRLTFEFPAFVKSGLKVKTLKVIEANGMYTPARWIRYITHTDSFEVRF